MSASLVRAVALGTSVLASTRSASCVAGAVAVLVEIPISAKASRSFSLASSRFPARSDLSNLGDGASTVAAVAFGVGGAFLGFGLSTLPHAACDAFSTFSSSPLARAFA